MYNKEKFLQIAENLSVKQLISIASGVLLILLWIFLNPKLGKLESLKSEIRETNIKLQQERISIINADKSIRELPTYKEKIQDFESKSEEAKRHLFLEDEITSLVNMLTFKEDSISYLLFETQTIEEEDLYKALPINIYLECTYPLLCQYLNYIEEMMFFVKIDEITIKKIEGSYNKISTELKLTAYVAKENN